MMGERPIQSRWREGDEDQLLTVGEVCDAMRVSNMTVYRLIKSGDLPAIRLGKTYRVLESEVERYLSGLLVMVEAE
jgi:excisionase family DNA binding protein